MPPALKQTAPAPSAAERPPLRFERVRSPRAFEEIASQIRGQMSQGRLRIGSKLPSERDLSEQFGVSRNTVREALRSLEHAGLIRQQKGAAGGSFVDEGAAGAVSNGLLDMYHLGAIQPAQLTQARIWLESIIVREACRNATPAFLQELEENIASAEEATRQGDFGLRAQRHIEFHRILARMTGNPVMVTLMNGVLEVLQHFVMRIGDYNNDYVLPSRRRFMKHMAAGDAEAAVAEMEASLKRLQRSYMSRIEQDQEKR